MRQFRSEIFIHPGLGNSGSEHWQSLWCKLFPEFHRIEQAEWETPECETWIANLDREIMKFSPENVILVGHSLACCTIAYWARKYGRKIKAAMLVGPSDTEAPSYPPGTNGFTPIPLIRLPFPSLVVLSSDDPYVSVKRGMLFAENWGSEMVNIGNAGHINVASGHGNWNEGIELLRKLDQKF